MELICASDTGWSFAEPLLVLLKVGWAFLDDVLVAATASGIMFVSAMVAVGVAVVAGVVVVVVVMVEEVVIERLLWLTGG